MGPKTEYFRVDLQRRRDLRANIFEAKCAIDR